MTILFSWFYHLWESKDWKIVPFSDVKWSILKSFPVLLHIEIKLDGYSKNAINSAVLYVDYSKARIQKKVE